MFESPQLCLHKNKMQFFSVTTQLYYLTSQLHVLPTVSSHDHAIPKNIKRKRNITGAILVGDLGPYKRVM